MTNYIEAVINALDKTEYPKLLSKFPGSIEVLTSEVAGMIAFGYNMNISPEYMAEMICKTVQHIIIKTN